MANVLRSEESVLLVHKRDHFLQCQFVNDTELVDDVLESFPSRVVRLGFGGLAR